MAKIKILFLFLIANVCFGQKSDFKHINFTKADSIAKAYKSKRLLGLNKITFDLTKDLETDVEKLRAIYIWICNNVANDFKLYSLNERKRNRFAKDSIKLQNWNSKFKKKLFKKLLKKKRTICTGYAYLLKEMCNIVDIKSKMVNGFGKTSSVDFENLNMPNHTWNIVKLNNKWYLCDPTWSTGISFPEEGRFQFTYNDGYFLTNPKLFILNHFPIEQQFSLLGQETPSLQDFTEAPLVYGAAYLVLKEHILPKKMHHTIKKGSTFTFKYQLKEKVSVNKVKLSYFTNNSETILNPEIHQNDDFLTLKHSFKNRGFYDIHLFIDKKTIATYTFKVTK